VNDQILIRGLEVQCIVGIFPEERQRRQPVKIDLEVEVDSHLPASNSDNFEDAVDYKSLHDDVYDLIDGSRFHLIETLSQRIADRVLEHPRVQAVTVTLDKPQALNRAESVAIKIRRERPSESAG